MFLAPSKYDALQGGTAAAPLRHVEVQAGAPTKVEYLDVLGRVVATGTQDMQGHEVITKIDYNERGLKVGEHQPLSTTGPLTAGAPSGSRGSWDGTTSSQYGTFYSGLDQLGRTGTKTVVRNPLSRDNPGDANMITNYAYAVDANGRGLTTSISVVRASGNLTMSRTYDARNKLVQTVQHVNSPAHDVTVGYTYDPEGNLLSIVGPPLPSTGNSDFNTLTATYDELGRKLTVDDPDRGKWAFSYDGLGRVRRTTDSNGTVVAAQYDPIGRQERRFVSHDGAAFRLDANWQYDLNGAPGTLGAMLGADDGAALDTTAPAFRRDYAYDTALRLVADTVSVGSGSAGGNAPSWGPESLTVRLAYDGQYGRLKGTAYPSGEVVAFDYDSSIGFPIGESPVIAGGGRDTINHYRRVTAISPRGQVAAQQFLNGVSETTNYDDSTGLFLSISATGLSHETLPTQCATAPYPMLKQLGYTYDPFDNLRKQTKSFYLRDSNGYLECSGSTAVATATASELYSYDDLQRLTSASRTWTGTTWSPPTTPSDSYTYDDLGNILSKSDYGDTYQYNVTRNDPSHSALPHAVGTVLQGGLTKASFLYDPNGNLTSGDGRKITYDDFDRPVKVEMGSVTTIFRYAPDGSRYLQQTTTPSAGTPVTKTVYYLDKYYERVDWSDGKQTEEHTYIGPNIAVYQSGAKHDVRYLHVDRLGSVEAVTSSAGAEMPYDAHSFDAFGKPRARDWQAQDKLHPTGDYTATTEHGFTGHEHLDDTYLIHMNGRVYDYRLGRFLSVDPLVSNPRSSQSLNPYSYVWNNPLAGIDPTGYAPDVFGYIYFPGNGAANLASAAVADTGNPTVIAQQSGFFVAASLQYFAAATGLFKGLIGPYIGAPLSEPRDPSEAYGMGAGKVLGAGIQAVEAGAGFAASVGAGAVGAAATPETGPVGAAVLLESAVGAAASARLEGAAIENGSQGLRQMDAAAAAMREPAAPQSGERVTTYQTYTKSNGGTGEVYSGRTSGRGTPEENVQDRDARHHMNDKGFGPAALDKSSSNKDAIRGREQQLIDANGGAKSQGGTSGNAINGISPNNKKRDIYTKASDDEFGF